MHEVKSLFEVSFQVNSTRRIHLYSDKAFSAPVNIPRVEKLTLKVKMLNFYRSLNGESEVKTTFQNNSAPPFWSPGYAIFFESKTQTITLAKIKKVTHTQCSVNFCKYFFHCYKANYRKMIQLCYLS